MNIESKTNNKKIFFGKLDSVNNPRSIHGIYPYRGKISSIDARQIVRQFKKGKVLLDPFCGSGTIPFEGQQHGLEVYGIDNNPLAVILARAKIETKNLNSELGLAKDLVNKAIHLPHFDVPDIIREYFHSDTAQQCVRLSKFFSRMTNYVKAAFMGAVCLAARGCNHYKWTSVTVGKKIEPFRKINFYEKFLSKVEKHLEETKRNGSVFKADARDLLEYLDRESVDYVFTSPPYFDALDYTAYHAKFIFALLEWDRANVRKGLIQNVATYEKDIRITLEQIHKVTRRNGLVVFVVGDKKMPDGTTVNGADFFNKITPFKKSYVVERTYNGTSSSVIDAINKTRRKEQIIVWEK